MEMLYNFWSSHFSRLFKYDSIPSFAPNLLPGTTLVLLVSVSSKNLRRDLTNPRVDITFDVVEKSTA